MDGVHQEQCEGLEAILNNAKLSDAAMEEAIRLLYGKRLPQLAFDKPLLDFARENDFDLQGYSINAQPEQCRNPRKVTVAAIQNKIVLPTSAPVNDQRYSIHQTFAMDGICRVGGKWPNNQVPQTERDEEIDDTIWNKFLFLHINAIPSEAKVADHFVISNYDMCSAKQCLVSSESAFSPVQNGVIISHTGKYIGKTRKNHIPRVGDFNESTYYMESNLGHPVFETVFGRIAVNICYGRHHPQNWLMFALNGAEIIFNPSATINGLSEALWPVEARNAAIANHVYTVGINRVGVEVFPNEFTSANGKPAHKDFGHFYGSSYVAAPDGCRTPGLSRTREGVLIAELDLNLCRQTKDSWGFKMTQRLDLYAQKLAECSKPNYRPQIIKEQ